MEKVNELATWKRVVVTAIASILMAVGIFLGTVLGLGLYGSEMGLAARQLVAKIGIIAMPFGVGAMAIFMWRLLGRTPHLK